MLLNRRVSIGAVISLGTFLSLFDVVTHFRSNSHISSSVFCRVVVDAMLMIVILGDVTGADFENI